MAMAALLAASLPPSPTSVLYAHRHRAALRHVQYAAAAFFQFQNWGHLFHSSSSKCGALLHLGASVAREGGGELRAGVHVEDVTLGLSSCLEVAENGSRYLHVMASSTHNVDNGCIIIGLTCAPITRGHSSARNLEFPSS